MARKMKSEGEAGALKPVTKTDFARRLYTLMLGKGWRQAELARRAGLPRDSVSTYIRGKTLPTTTSATKLARALGVEPTELLPYAVENNPAARGGPVDLPELNLTIVEGKAFLQINQYMPTDLAMKMIGLLNEHKQQQPAS